MSASLTRQHFRAIADAVRTMGLDDETRLQVARGLVPTLRRFNARFDAATFIDAAAGPACPGCGHRHRT